MASLQGFYTLTDESRDGVTAEVRVSIHRDHPVYDGHFPGQPVAPGAALTQMVIDEAARLVEGNLTFSGARQVKFLSVLNPDITSGLTLRYTFAERDGQQQFACVGTDGETVFFKINGAFD